MRSAMAQISVYPAHTISDKVKETIAEYTRRLAKALHVKGLINIQFIAVGEEVFVIEVNPRSSRTVPYISRVTGRRTGSLAMSPDCRRKRVMWRSRCRYSPSRRSEALRSALARR